jgi:hypothetical protein
VDGILAPGYSQCFKKISMSFDGSIILRTTDGYVLALSRDFKEEKSIRPSPAKRAKSKPTQGCSVDWCGDEKGGI